MIDPHALVSPDATLGENVEIGPFAIVEAGVTIGSGTRIGAHAYVCTGTRLGHDNVVHMNVVLGHEPQDVAFTGEPSYLVIGDRNVFREGCQVHRGTRPGSETVIGSQCYFMGNSHVGHNCRVGNDVILTNGALLGGYAEVGDRVFISGNAAVHQHARIGRLAMIQGLSGFSQDVPPFLIGSDVNIVRGVNVVGLRRAGFSRPQIEAIRRMYRALFARRHNLHLARERFIADETARGGLSPEVEEVLAFIATAKHGVCVGPRRGRTDARGADDDA
jgi:UDP-N-acetylglucosamine acyltransferase